MYLEKMQNINQQVLRYKATVQKWYSKENAQYKLKVLKVSLLQNDEKLWCTWNMYTCNLKHLHKTH